VHGSVAKGNVQGWFRIGARPLLNGSAIDTIGPSSPAEPCATVELVRQIEATASTQEVSDKDARMLTGEESRVVACRMGSVCAAELKVHAELLSCGNSVVIDCLEVETDGGLSFSLPKDLLDKLKKEEGSSGSKASRSVPLKISMSVGAAVSCGIGSVSIVLIEQDWLQGVSNKAYMKLNLIKASPAESSPGCIMASISEVCMGLSLDSPDLVKVRGISALVSSQGEIKVSEVHIDEARAALTPGDVLLLATINEIANLKPSPCVEDVVPVKAKRGLFPRLYLSNCSIRCDLVKEGHYACLHIEDLELSEGQGDRMTCSLNGAGLVLNDEKVVSLGRGRVVIGPESYFVDVSPLVILVSDALPLGALLHGFMQAEKALQKSLRRLSGKDKSAPPPLLLSFRLGEVSLVLQGSRGSSQALLRAKIRLLSGEIETDDAFSSQEGLREFASTRTPGTVSDLLDIFGMRLSFLHMREISLRLEESNKTCTTLKNKNS